MIKIHFTLHEALKIYNDEKQTFTFYDWYKLKLSNEHWHIIKRVLYLHLYTKHHHENTLRQVFIIENFEY